MLAEDEESQVRHDLLVTALESLNDREKHILMERRLADEPKTLEELSQVYGVSRERIRQIEVRAFEKLQARCCGWRASEGCFRPDGHPGLEPGPAFLSDAEKDGRPRIKPVHGL